MFNNPIRSFLQEKRKNEYDGMENLMYVPVEMIFISSDEQGEYIKIKEDYALDPKVIEKALSKGVGYVVLPD